MRLAGWAEWASTVAGEIDFMTRRPEGDFVRAWRPVWTGGGVPVFTFHGAPADFRDALAFLAANGYETISPDDLLGVLAGQAPPAKSVVLTFDDGLESVWRTAAPALARTGFTAAAFVVTGWVGRPGYMTWSQIADLQSEGRLVIGSHTDSHPALDRLDPVSIRNELCRSKAVLESRLGTPVHHLCLPYGRGSAAVIQAARSAGYRSIFWDRRPGRVMNRVGDDPFSVTRLKHDFLFRLPGRGRRSMIKIAGIKVLRRCRGMAYA